MGAYSAEVLSATSWNFININISININIKINGSPTLIRGKKRTVITINSIGYSFNLAVFSLEIQCGTTVP
jgi:hypothetical protein